MTTENNELGDQIEALYAEIETTGINYSDYDEEFISDMKDRWDAGYSFSVKQVARIERLYSKYIDGSDEGTEEDTYERFKRGH